MRNLIIICLFVGPIVQGRHEQYEGHKLFRVTGHSETIASLDGPLDILSVTRLAPPSSDLLDALVRLSPKEMDQWLKYFDDNDMVVTKIADNLADILRNEEAQLRSSKTSSERNGWSMSWDTYYSHDEINNYLDKLAVEHPDLVTVINAGLSYEGRQIKYVRISTSRFENPRKPVIIIDAATHAREWVTPPVALYVIEQLVNRTEEDLTDKIDWIIIPVVNPDGYNYSMTEDRMWRKTRSRAHADSDTCPGVDGNRNFDHHWNDSIGNSPNPCSDLYRGPSPFSEPEIRVVRDVVLQQLERTSMFITLHSSGNQILYPWGNNSTLPDNALMLHYVGVNMAEAIDKHALEISPPYTVGSTGTVLYLATGISSDWVRAVGVLLSYTYELPGFGYGFVVPPEYIEQIVKETWQGIAAGGFSILYQL